MKKIYLVVFCCLFSFFYLGNKSQAAPVFAESQMGNTRGLVPSVTVPWSSSSTTLYTCANPNGFVLLHVIPRSPTGTQPLSFTVTLGGSTILAAIGTGSIVIGNNLTIPNGVTAVGTVGQTVVVTPLTTTTGTMTFDILGYELP